MCFSDLQTSCALSFGGSLPQKLSAQDVCSLVKKLQAKGCLCIVDTPGFILKKALLEKPFCIKPNLQEFQELTGTRVSSLASVLSLAKKITQEVKVVCVSSVEGGALLVTQQQAWFGKIPDIEVCSTTGAGDSMVGALAVEIAKCSSSVFDVDKQGATWLRWGLAAAAATLATPGPAFGTKAQIHRYFKQIQVQEVSDR